MHKIVSFNGKLFSDTEVDFSPISSAALYGKGIFTTLAIKEKKPFLWEKHWRRLNDNALKIGIDLSDFSEDFLIDSFNKLIEKNEIATGRARITFFDESASRIWNFETERKTSLLITTAERRKAKSVFDLTISPFPANSASPLAGVKSCNYLDNILALDDAKQRGFDEAVRLNERGEIVSAAMANIFWLKNETVFTPALETGCLAGTTREFLLEKISVCEVKSGLENLSNAEAVFLTSAGIGICPANYEKIKSSDNSKITKLKYILDNAEQ